MDANPIPQKKKKKISHEFQQAKVMVLNYTRRSYVSSV